MVTLSTAHIIGLSIVLRIGFFAFGIYQDHYMTVKYTDIDYLVFSDAANYVYHGQSPYLRETYRYTPLLAWMLVPNSWSPYWYNFGKFVFVVSDIITGVIITKLLVAQPGISKPKASVLSAIWLLNPMVITISTRGSSESVLTVMIMLAVYFLQQKNVVLSAFWLGLLIHFKVYPIIYLPAILLYLSKGTPIVNLPIIRWINVTNIKYLVVTLVTLAGMNWIMYSIYGYEFLYHSYLYHLTRLDHRHNFSLYNISLYYKSAEPISDASNLLLKLANNVEKLAFIPQLLVSAIILPLVFARSNLISCLFLQTFAFVLFNKVITSQYFIWYLIFLPIYLSKSKLLTTNKVKGLILLALWVVSQATWLYFAYNLEFLGISTFDGGLLYSSAFFYLSNCYILGEFIADIGTSDINLQ